MDTIKKNILIHAFKPLVLDEKIHANFFSIWEEVSFERGELITERGQVDRYFYVVISGVQCVYIISTSGDKKVIGFSFDGSFSGIYDSFVYERPSAYYLESLSRSKLLRMNKADYDELFKQYPEFEHWGRVVHLDLLVGRVNREVELITKSSKERFESFMQRCPEKLKTIPQKYLASYLNMTPETFSRLRSSFS